MITARRLPVGEHSRSLDPMGVLRPETVPQPVVGRGITADGMTCPPRPGRVGMVSTVPLGRGASPARALHRQAMAAISASPGARAYYDRLRARGVGHQAALRQLANRLVGILHGRLRSGRCYDEDTAWPAGGDAAA